MSNDVGQVAPSWDARPPRFDRRRGAGARHLAFAVENEMRDAPPREGGRYGGLALLAGMARLFGWREFSAGSEGERFLVSWRAQLRRRDSPGRPD